MNRSEWQAFYIFFVIVGNFFLSNLFAGVVVDSFNTERDKLGGFSEMTEAQKNWILIQQRILKLKPEANFRIDAKGLR